MHCRYTKNTFHRSHIYCTLLDAFLLELNYLLIIVCLLNDIIILGLKLQVINIRLTRYTILDTALVVSRSYLPRARRPMPEMSS